MISSGALRALREETPSGQDLSADLERLIDESEVELLQQQLVTERGEMVNEVQQREMAFEASLQERWNQQLTRQEAQQEQPLQLLQHEKTTAQVALRSQMQISFGTQLQSMETSLYSHHEAMVQGIQQNADLDLQASTTELATRISEKFVARVTAIEQRQTEQIALMEGACVQRASEELTTYELETQRQLHKTEQVYSSRLALASTRLHEEEMASSQSLAARTLQTRQELGHLTSALNDRDIIQQAH